MGFPWFPSSYEWDLQNNQNRINNISIKFTFQVLIRKMILIRNASCRFRFWRSSWNDSIIVVVIFLLISLYRGARHGLGLSGKLARVELQDQSHLLSQHTSEASNKRRSIRQECDKQLKKAKKKKKIDVWNVT